MKSVLFLLAALLPMAAQADGTPVDTAGISRNVPLDEVVVTATRAAKGTPVAYSDVTREELQRRNDGQGIPYLILQSPSVIMTSDAGTGIGYSGFRIRGTDANRINITVNGVPVNDAESHTVFWVNMPDFASSVENIQIQRGAGTSTNGPAAFGATVAMQTQPPSTEPYGEYSISAGSFGTVRHTVKGGTGLLYDHFVFDARYSNVRSDGFIDRADARMSSWFASAAWYGATTLVRFQTFGSSEKTYQAWNGVPADSLRAGNRTYNSCGSYFDADGVERFYNNQTDNYWQQHYHLTASQRLGDRWDANLTLHYTPGNGYYEDYRYNKKYADYKLPDFTDAAGDVQKKSDFIRRKWLDSDFYGGIFSANYRQEKLQAAFGGAVNNYVCDHFGRILWAKAANALPDPNYEYYRNRGKKLDYSAYAKANWQFLPGWNGYLDMQYRGIDYRIDGDDDKGGDDLHVKRHWDFFNPKAGLNFHTGHHNAFASFAVANREPSRDNFTEVGPEERASRSIHHETLYDYEAGYAFTHPRFQAGVNLYYMDYNNQLILTGKISEIGEALTTNIKDSYRMGVELTAGAVVADWLRWSGNLTLSRNKIRHFTENLPNYDANWELIANQPSVDRYLGTTDIAFSPAVIAGSLFDFDWRGFSAGLYSRYVGRQYMDNTSARERSIDPYFVTDLTVGYAFRPSFLKEVRLDVSVNNLFNEHYETNGTTYSSLVAGERSTESTYFTQAGTNAMARVTIKF